MTFLLLCRRQHRNLIYLQITNFHFYFAAFPFYPFNFWTHEESKGISANMEQTCTRGKLTSLLVQENELFFTRFYFTFNISSL